MWTRDRGRQCRGVCQNDAKGQDEHGSERCKMIENDYLFTISIDFDTIFLIFV